MSCRFWSTSMALEAGVFEDFSVDLQWRVNEAKGWKNLHTGQNRKGSWSISALRSGFAFLL